jgi:hypothetical protein
MGDGWEKGADRRAALIAAAIELFVQGNAPKAA